MARRCMVFLEGNDSLLMRTAIRLGLHSPYELQAVRANNHEAGGVRNSALPNFIYRWSLSTLRQTVCSGFPERRWNVRAHRFFELSSSKEDLAIRQDGIGRLSSAVGPGTFLRTVRAAEALANATPIARQGNHFLAIIEKGEPHPWIERDGDSYRLARSKST